MQQFIEVLDSIGPLQISPSAYDTAWLSRVGGEVGDRARQWLLENQNADGSWGAAVPWYFHDRVVATLSAVSALIEAGMPATAPPIRRAQVGLRTAISALAADAAGPTVGFELTVPTLVIEARALGVEIPESSYLERLLWARSAKLGSLPSRRIDRYSTPSFSAEAVGRDHLHLLDPANLQSANGSVAFSPSATAFFWCYVSQDPAAWRYLLSAVGPDGAVPYVGPIDVFDHAWVLWNLSLVPGAARDPDVAIRVETSAAFLREAWQPGLGIASAAGLPIPDGDATSVVFASLALLGYPLDIESVLGFKAAYYFRCYPLESDPSTSTNVHVLHALRAAGRALEDPAVQTVIRFLRTTQVAELYWHDKWHASPYYPTAHAIIALAGLCDDVAENAVEWLVETQRRDGAWGWFTPTAEETAYALQALAIWRRTGHDVPEDVVRRGRQWLVSAEMIEPFPVLWIGKCLYAPAVPIRAAIASALLLTEA